MSKESQASEAQRRIPAGLKHRMYFSAYNEDYGLFECAYCGDLRVKDAVSIDHKTPRFHGGDNSRENLCVCCVWCNFKKGAMSVSAYLAWLKRNQHMYAERDVWYSSWRPPPSKAGVNHFVFIPSADRITVYLKKCVLGWYISEVLNVDRRKELIVNKWFLSSTNTYQAEPEVTHCIAVGRVNKEGEFVLYRKLLTY